MQLAPSQRPMEWTRSIATSRLVLERLRAGDAGALFAYRGDADVASYQSWVHCESVLQDAGGALYLQQKGARDLTEADVAAIDAALAAVTIDDNPSCEPGDGPTTSLTIAESDGGSVVYRDSYRCTGAPYVRGLAALGDVLQGVESP
jgi:hypothetical protein